jgi:hypothetical protein
MTMLTPAVETIPFRRPAEAVLALGGETAARAVTVASDIALVVDDAGVILDLAVNSADLAVNGSATSWTGPGSTRSPRKADRRSPTFFATLTPARRPAGARSTIRRRTAPS